MKYIETRKQDPFNWHAEIHKAQVICDEYWNTADAPEPLVTQYHATRERLAELASSWVTCACGNQCAIFPRNDIGEPYDTKLATWGVLFYEAVNKADWDVAKGWLNKIEERSWDMLLNIYTAPQPLAANPMILL